MMLPAVIVAVLVLIQQAGGIPCSPSSQSFVVESTTDSSAMANAVNCSGGIFDVEWIGSVIVEQTIKISAGSTLTVTGVSDGGVKPVVDGESRLQLFNVDNATLHLDGVDIVNGQSPFGGGVEAFNSILTATNCTFSGHSDSAVNATASSIVLDGYVSFVGNAGEDGGGMRMNNSNTEVHGVALFEANTATINGAGIYLATDSTLGVTGSLTLVQNAAGKAGGGILALFGSSVDVLGRVHFEDNSSGGGGAIGIYGDSRLLLRGDGTFVNNTALIGTIVDTGGAVYGALASLVSISGQAEFERNDARFGGAVACLEDTLIEVDGSASFVNNSATTNGGGVFLNSSTWAQSGIVQFEGNYAHKGGGMILFSVSLVSISGNMSFVGNEANTTGGGISAHDGSTVTAADADLIFASNTAHVVDGSSETEFEEFGGAIAVDNSSLALGLSTRSIFENNSARRLGGACFALNSSSVEFFGNTTFFENEAQYGGAMGVQDSDLTIYFGKTTFADNKATEFGGGLFVERSNSVFHGESIALATDFHGQGIAFANNTAETGGAMFIRDNPPPLIEDVVFENNTASSGGAIATSFTGDSSKTAYMGSCTFKNNVADSDGGALELQGGKIIFISCAFNSNVAGASGGAVKSSATLYVTDSRYSANYALSGAAIANAGELYMENVTFDGNGLLCESGQFVDPMNVSEYVTSCDSCPGWNECSGCVALGSGGICTEVMPNTRSVNAEGTLASLQIDPGYWRNTRESKVVLTCYNTDACMGGTAGDEICAIGYQGPYCAVCEEGYAPGLMYTCQRCQGGRDTAALAIGVVIILCIAVGAVLLVLYMLAPEHSDVETKHGWSGMLSRMRKLVPLQAIKIVIVASQIVSQFASVASVTYPDAYEAFLDILDFTNLDIGWIVSAGCYIDTDFFDTLLIMTLGPVVALLFLGTTYAVAKRRAGRGMAALANIRRRHLSVLLLVLFLVYATVSSTVFQTFVCDPLDDGYSYLRADHRIACGTARHNAYKVYAIFMVVLYPVGIPLFYAALLYSSRHRLKADDRSKDLSVRPFEDLWKPYRPSKYYYEVVECARRISLTGITVFILPNTAGQVAVTFLFALFFEILAEVLHPFVSTWDTWLYRTGSMIVLLSMFFALLLKVDVSQEDGSSERAVAGVLITLHVGIALALVVEAGGMCCSAVKTHGKNVPMNRSMKGSIDSFAEELPEWDRERDEGESDAGKEEKSSAPAS